MLNKNIGAIEFLQGSRPGTTSLLNPGLVNRTSDAKILERTAAQASSLQGRPEDVISADSLYPSRPVIQDRHRRDAVIKIPSVYASPVAMQVQIQIVPEVSLLRSHCHSPPRHSPANRGTAGWVL